MRTKTKLITLATGVALSALVVAAPAVSAASMLPGQDMAQLQQLKELNGLKPSKLTLTDDNRLRQPIAQLDQTANSVLSVATQVDCNNHRLTARVSNTTASDITPQVFFNQLPANSGSLPTIAPGKTVNYSYGFSGNQTPIEVKVMSDGQPDTLLTPTPLCVEPVTFRVEAASDSAVTGYLQNNSSLLPQTVLTRIGSGDVRTEILAPGESRLIALPFTGYPDQRQAFVTIAVTGGYEGTYTVDLEHPVTPVPPVIPPVPLPEPQSLPV